jgi:hypothetical protein
MSGRGGRKRRLAAVAAVVALSSIALVGCSPKERTAVRVNDDGTVDFASCVAVSVVTGVDATTHLRTGPHGSVDDATETRLELDVPLSSLQVGQVVTFRGVPERWDRMDIHVDALSTSVGAPIERGRIVIGEWYWGDAPGWFADFVPAERCALVDGDGLPVT